jgi:hypothetical protein
MTRTITVGIALLLLLAGSLRAQEAPVKEPAEPPAAEKSAEEAPVRTVQHAEPSIEELEKMSRDAYEAG